MQTDDKLRSREKHAGEKEPGFVGVSIFGGAIVACCLIVPLLVALSSTGAVLGSLDAFASLRPYLIAGAGVLALLAVFYFFYRRLRRPDASSGDACQPKRSALDSKSAP